MSERIYTETSYRIGDINPKIFVVGHAKLDLKTGDVSFEEGFEPTKCAEIFWSAIMQEYREYLKWKESR